MDFSNALINGVPLVVVILGLVEWCKRLGVSGRALQVASMLIGAVMGVLYRLSVGMPTDFSGWLAAGMYGLALGLIASGVYDAARSAITQG